MTETPISLCSALTKAAYESGFEIKQLQMNKDDEGLYVITLNGSPCKPGRLIFTPAETNND